MTHFLRLILVTAICGGIALSLAAGHSHIRTSPLIAVLCALGLVALVLFFISLVWPRLKIADRRKAKVRKPRDTSASPEADAEISLVDQLTRLANQRYLMMFLNQEISRSVRNGQPISIILLDVDGLDRINSESGREAGDMLLQSMSAALKEMVREYDLVARYAADEFAVVLPETAAPDALEIAERIHRSLPQSLGNLATTSVGVATYPDHGTNADDLLSSAHHALNRAKFGGRNSVCSCHRLARAS